MRLRSFFLIIVLTCTCGVAQIKPASPPVEFDPLLEALKSEVIDVNVVIKGIQDRGIAFDLGKAQLEAIVSSAAEGKRRPGEIAAVIAASLDSCQKCYARFLAPLTQEELLALLKRGHDNDILLQEVKARGVKDLDISEANANVLRAAGANEELVRFLVPDDKVKISPLIGYKTFELKHAEEYDPSAPEGWLKVTAEIPANSASEFFFKHNALFGRAVNGGEPTVLSAYFNKPAPRNTDFEHIEFTPTLEGGEATGGDEKRGGGFRLGIGKGKSKDEKAKEAPPLDVAYPGADDTGRNSFQIRLANKQATPQQYSFTLRWRVLTAPKPAPAPLKPAPSSKK
jgi:translation elongation factor EF-1beta